MSRKRQFAIPEQPLPSLTPLEQAVASVAALSQEEKITLVKLIAGNLGVKMFTQADVQEITKTALRLQLQKYGISKPLPDGAELIRLPSWKDRVT